MGLNLRVGIGTEIRIAIIHWVALIHRVALLMCDMVRGFSSEGWGSDGGDRDNHGCDDLQDTPPNLDGNFQASQMEGVQKEIKEIHREKNKFSISGYATPLSIKGAMKARWRDRRSSL